MEVVEQLLTEKQPIRKFSWLVCIILATNFALPATWSRFPGPHVTDLA